MRLLCAWITLSFCPHMIWKGLGGAVVTEVVVTVRAHGLAVEERCVHSASGLLAPTAKINTACFQQPCFTAPTADNCAALATVRVASLSQRLGVCPFSLVSCARVGLGDILGLLGRIVALCACLVCCAVLALCSVGPLLARFALPSWISSSLKMWAVFAAAGAGTHAKASSICLRERQLTSSNQ